MTQNERCRQPGNAEPQLGTGQYGRSGARRSQAWPGLHYHCRIALGRCSISARSFNVRLATTATARPV